MKPDLWIPARTPPQPREVLAALANVHDFSVKGPLPDRMGHGDMLVSAHDVRAALEVIPRIDGLRVVQTFSAGVDSIVDRIPPGITLCNATGVHDVSVAEWVLMAILASNRRLSPLVEAQARGQWLRKREVADDLDGATVLIVGYGSIGAAVEARLAPFGARIERVARRAREGVHAIDDLPELLPDADVVVILLPLTPATQRLVDADVLSRMREGALLVNASRGGVVDTEALMAALRAGRIRAALDVTDPEPLPDGHPLWSLPGVLITPHVAGDVQREEERAWQLVADQVGRLARGEPLRNVVVDGY
jgi:phosphoglycerate dehydrogenase-like enzyme